MPYKNSDENKKYFHQYHLRNREKRSLQTRCRKHKTTVEEIERVLKFQNNRCAICRNEFDRTQLNSYHLDHNHLFDRGFRGILCCHCNRLLGAARDRIDILEKAIQYLDLEIRS